MKWLHPPVKQIYEALSCIADERIEVDGNSAKVYSSSKGKFYGVSYDKEKNSIMANDNTSYWKSYLGYPSIAFLMKTGTIYYNPKCAHALKGIVWKDINVKFKNDFDKAIEYVRELLEKKGTDMEEFDGELENIDSQIKKLDLNMLGSKVKPPEGY
jgi:hypothetical protein